MDWLESLFPSKTNTLGGPNSEIRAPRSGELGYGKGTVPNLLTQAIGLVPAPVSFVPRVAKNIYETGQPKVAREAANAVRDTFLQALFGLGGNRAIKTVTSAGSSAPKLDPLTLIHGTSESAAQKILAKNEFRSLGDTLEGRNYTYSELGPDTMYFTRPNRDSQFWNSADAGASRAAEYSQFVESRLSPDAKLYPVTGVGSWESLAKKAGFKNGKELNRELFFEYGTGDKEWTRRAKGAVDRIRKMGYDGLDIQVPSSDKLSQKQWDAIIESGLPSGPQVAVFSTSKVKPIGILDRKGLEAKVK